MGRRPWSPLGTHGEEAGRRPPFWRVRSDAHRSLECLCCGRLRLVKAVQTQQQPPEWTDLVP
eukprot:scaffold129131_cov36-Phaeocystis_antarctica.AAC.1